MPLDYICAPPDGFCGCVLCDDHFWSVETQTREKFRYEEKLTDDEATSSIQDLLSEIESNVAYVKAKLETHGDLVINRWSKKSKEKRASSLGTAAPEVFGEWPARILQHADLATEAPGTSSDSIFAMTPELVRRNHSFMPPRYNICVFGEWLDIKDFMEDRMKLLSLLYVRTASPPQRWVLFDSRRFWFYFRHGDIPLLYNDKCVRLCGDEYGSLTTYDEPSSHHWAIAGSTRAHATFCGQMMITHALRSLVDNIIGDAAGTGNSKWLAAVEAGFRSSGCEALWSPYTHQPFTPPQAFDPKLLLLKAQLRHDLVMDEVELMQTDPAYMHHVIKQMKASVVYNDTNGSKLDLRYRDMATNLIILGLRARVMSWRLIVHDCNYTCKVFEEYKHAIEPGKPVPHAIDLALNALGGRLCARLDSLGNLFDLLLPSLKPFKERFMHIPVDGRTALQAKTTLDAHETADRMYWILHKVRGWIKCANPVGAFKWFDMLEREMLSNTAATLVDQRFYDLLSDLATIDEMRALWLWSQMNSTLIPDEELQQFVLERDPGQGTKAPILNDRCRDRIGRALRRFSESPWPKEPPSGRRDLQWLEKADVCRQRLSTLWQVTREELRGVDESRGTSESGMD